MRNLENDGSAANHITRILILSYFLALAGGLINGAEFSRLASPFLADPFATYVTSTVVVVLSAMVLVGFFRRPAALILALILFWASYMTMFATGDLTGFWRDLALMAGLLMSAGVGSGFSIARRAPNETEDDIDMPRIISKPLHDAEDPQRPPSVSRFREDLSLAREG